MAEDTTEKYLIDPYPGIEPSTLLYRQIGSDWAIGMEETVLRTSPGSVLVHDLGHLYSDTKRAAKKMKVAVPPISIQRRLRRIATLPSLLMEGAAWNVQLNAIESGWIRVRSLHTL